MTIVSILDKATNSWSSIVTLATIASTFLFVVVPRLQENMNVDEAGPPPDLRYGYNSTELNDWYDAIGEEGCRSYKIMALLDLFPYMQCYTLLLGGMLVKAARLGGQNPDIGLLMPVVMLCDVVETIIPAYGCFLFPERLPPLLIQVSAAASRLKWTLFVVSNAVLSFLFFTSLLKSAVEKKKKMLKKKDSKKKKTLTKSKKKQ